MNLLRLLPKLIYTQVLLGAIAYALAESNPALLLFAVTFAVLAWLLVEAEGGRPLPRWLINLGVLGVMLWLVYTHFTMDRPIILGLGQFIVFIQIFKLYERKSNRDWGQLIVLSLMLVICASIISADVLFGVLLAAYLVVTLFAILVFQLKLGRDEVETATRKQTPAYARPLPTGAPATPRFRRHFNLLALSAGTTAIVLSGLFFVLIPRGQGSGVLGNWQASTQRSVSGYEEQISLSGGGRMSTSRLPVMNVAFSRNGRPVGSGGQAFLLRGTTLDDYDPALRLWVRSSEASRDDRVIRMSRGGGVDLASRYRDSHILTQSITLRAQPKDALFATFSPVEIEIGESIHFNPTDQSLSTRESSEGSIQYVVHSAQYTDPSLVENYRRRWQGALNREGRHGGRLRWEDYARHPVTSSERIRAFTLELLEPHGITRDPEVETSPDDRMIADLVSRYLQSQLEYSLDIPPVDRHTDPIEAFLFEYQRGHCEFFASAMCAMLRSIGIRSRIVTGFRATEYNAVGEYYVVRARNAHAWVEVWTEDEGWRTYDPSPPADLAAFHQEEGGIFAMVRDLYEYVEFQWINRIISYDAVQQRSVMTRLNESFDGVGARAQGGLDAVRGSLQNLHRDWMQGRGGYLLLVVIAGLFVSTAVFMLAGNLSRQRLFIRRLRLDAVGRRERRRLARQLDFYLKAMELVEQAGHHRPDWQTPAAFARQLVQREPDRFQPFVTLTDLFYEIRFGGYELDAPRQAAVQRHLADLRSRLSRPVAA